MSDSLDLKIVFAIIGIGLAIWLGPLLLPHRTKAWVSSHQPPEEVRLYYPSNQNYRQSINGCGPYSVAAILRYVRSKPVAPHEIEKKISWRLPNGYTIPWGLEGVLLKELQQPIESWNASELSNTQKKQFLMERMAGKRPIIILGKKNSSLHYLTLLGHKENGNKFFVYDSWHTKNPSDPALTVDDNGDEPGNLTLETDDLLTFWDQGNWHGLFKGYLLETTVYN